MRTAVAGAPLLEDRQRAFADVQRIMSDELPAIYFVAPRVDGGDHAAACSMPAPVLQLPQLLWSADTLAVSTGGADAR